MKYIGCGSTVEEMTIIHALGYNRFFVKPFGIDTEDMESTTTTDLSLLSKETIRSPWSHAPSRSIKLDSLAYVFYQFEQQTNSSMLVTNNSIWYLKQ